MLLMWCWLCLVIIDWYNGGDVFYVCCCCNKWLSLCD